MQHVWGLSSLVRAFDSRMRSKKKIYQLCKMTTLILFLCCYDTDLRWGRPWASDWTSPWYILRWEQGTSALGFGTSPPQERSTEPRAGSDGRGSWSTRAGSRWSVVAVETPASWLVWGHWWSHRSRLEQTSLTPGEDGRSLRWGVRLGQVGSGVRWGVRWDQGGVRVHSLGSNLPPSPLQDKLVQ